VANILKKIVASKKKELLSRMKELPLETILGKLITAPPTRPFKSSLRSKDGLALIAEIKRASPSKGILISKWDPKSLAKIYEKNGASAISVVTEEKFFKGSVETIAEVKKVCSLPVLRKDFIIDPYQIYESRLYKADAILLIASLYPKNRELKKMMQLAYNMSLTPVIEVATAAEWKRVSRLEADFIGINNRDLSTFKVDLKKTVRLLKNVPEDTIVISESGINDQKDAKTVFEAGAKAILVGEAILKSKNMPRLIQELSSVQEI
jgi:indole-3-glycerol phosphate synthase